MTTICLLNQMNHEHKPNTAITFLEKPDPHPEFSDRNVHFSQWLSATSEAKRHKHHRRSPQACDSLPSRLTQDRARWRVTVGDFISKALVW